MSRKTWLYIVIALLVFGVDQLTKAWARNSMDLYQSISVIGDFFRLTLVQNHNAAFSIGLKNPVLTRWLLISFQALASVVITVIIVVNRQKWLRLCLSFVLGGALGNLIDRIWLGSVTDFLDFDFFDIIYERWPVFNGADVAINIGITLYLLHELYVYIKGITNRRSHAGEKPDNITDPDNSVRF